jgi:hypothetical protein
MDELIGRGDDVPFELRLGQAIAWCEPRGVLSDPLGSMRSEELRPRTLGPDRASTVWSVVVARGHIMHKASPATDAAGLRGGRLLVYFPDENLFDGAAELESRGFFDVDNAPPWDTWVGLFHGKWNAFSSSSDHLISWVPPTFIDLVDRGIYVNPEQCICWLDDTDLAVAEHLRARGILPER